MQSINLISFNVTRTIVSHVKFTSNSREKSPRTIWISMKMRIFHVKPMLHVSENHVNVLSMWKLTRGTFAVQCILNATMDETVWKIKDIKKREQFLYVSVINCTCQTALSQWLQRVTMYAYLYGFDLESRQIISSGNKFYCGGWLYIYIYM